MCKILLSVNPEHVRHILDGSKEYEFRKTRCKEDIDGIIIYSTSPEKRVVGEAMVDMIIEDSPMAVWRVTHEKSGITKDFFFKYFQGRDKAVAYKLTNITVFEQPRKLEYYGIKSAPQSFVYV